MSRLLSMLALIWVVVPVPSDTPVSSPACPSLRMPVEGEVVAGFAPVGEYAGHWGVDLATEPGETVHSPGEGIVTFAGSVAGRRSVTVDLGDGELGDGEMGEGMVATVSYLGGVGVSVGDRVGPGDPLGTSGHAHGREAVHLSVRMNGEYIDPLAVADCRLGHLPDALRLVR